MPKFVRESIIAAPVERVFAFHESPDALQKLIPPFEHAEVVEPPRSLQVGTRVVVRTRVLPLVWATWEAEHISYEKNRLFVDRQVRGPFAHWVHRHRFERIDDHTCKLVDEVDYEVPLGALGAFFGGAIARRRIERMFDHRHAVTRAECERA